MVDCRIIVPAYWTSVTSVSFSFTPFNDSLSAITSYQWGLGSEPGLDNVMAFRPFNGSMKVKS